MGSVAHEPPKSFDRVKAQINVNSQNIVEMFCQGKKLDNIFR